MIDFSPPQALSGPERQQISQVYDYLYQMSQQLNLALRNLDSSNFSDGSTEQGILTGAAQRQTENALSDQYQQVRSIIIKTADIVRAEMQQLSVSLAGTYVAQSDFGSYVQQLSSYIEANPEAITQYYKFASDLEANLSTVDAAFTSYKTDTEGYIRTGIVYYTTDGITPDAAGTTPVYGVAVGQNLNAQTVNGETVIEQKRFRSTFTANRLSFWQDAREVAYISDNRLYISEINVLQRLTLGTWIMEDGYSGLTIRYSG